VTWPAGSVQFELGTVASKWLDRITHPPSRLEKLGVKPEWRASAISDIDRAFLKALARAVTHLSVGRVSKNCDAISLGATKMSELVRLDRLKSALKPNGAVWVIRPKGRPEITEQAVMAAGKAAGLVDIKVVGFSPTHTAEKFVIPVKDRGR
jgi:hypothetical protein